MLDEKTELCKVINELETKNQMQENRINELKVKLRNSELKIEAIEKIVKG